MIATAERPKTVPQPILVPLDGSDLAEQALPYAEALAGSRCELILLEVGEDEDDEFRLQERFDDSCAQLQTVFGDPVEQILQVAQELGAGLIVMTTRGHGAAGGRTFGSVAKEVMRKSSIPVLMIRPEEDTSPAVAPQIRRLVVPLDGSELVEQALPRAEVLAKQLHVPLHLVTAIGSEERTGELVSDAETLLSRHADRLRREGIPSSWEVLRGSPGVSFPEAVRAGDVIVLTSNGRGGSRRSLLGSVAEELVREGPVPVIVVPARDGRTDAPLGDRMAKADDLGSR